MSQIRIGIPDRSIAAVPYYSPEWKIAFGVNQNQSLQQNYNLKWLHSSKICYQQKYPTTVSPENFAISDEK